MTRLANAARILGIRWNVLTFFATVSSTLPMSYALPFAIHVDWFVQTGPDSRLSSQTIEDRRRKSRYPIALNVSYRGHGETPNTVGYGKTINISSSGILLAAGQALRPNTRVDLSIDWPFLLENEVPLQIWVRGRVARVHNDQVAITIENYEFRTVARSNKSERKL